MNSAHISAREAFGTMRPYAQILAALIPLCLLASVATCCPLEALLFTLLLFLGLMVYLRPLAGIALVITASLLNDAFSIYVYKMKVPFTAFFVMPVYIILFPRLLKGIATADRNVKWLFGGICFFAGWASISTLWSHETFGMFYFLMLVFLVQIFFFLVSSKEVLFKTLHIYIANGVFLGILLIASSWYSGEYTVKFLEHVDFSWNIWKGSDRPGGFAAGSSSSLILNTFLFASIAMLYRGSLAKKTAGCLLVVFFLVCIGLNGSKVGILSLALGILILIFSAPQFRNYRIRGAVFLTMPFLFMLLVAGAGFFSRIIVMLEKPLDVQKSNSRSTWWSEGLKRTMETYGVGLGAGGLRDYLISLPIANVHSLYFSTFFDLGLIGIFLLAVLSLLLVAHIRKTLKHSSDGNMIFLAYCFIAALSAMGVHAATEGDYAYVFFWLFLSLTVVVMKNAAAAKTI